MDQEDVKRGGGVGLKIGDTGSWQIWGTEKRW
jgi:hypothetical protein